MTQFVPFKFPQKRNAAARAVGMLDGYQLRTFHCGATDYNRKSAYQADCISFVQWIVACKVL